MDQELKQRLIGAAVITALAAIFIPMLFDDAVDEVGKEVNMLTLPPIPTKEQEVEIAPLPDKTEDIVTETTAPTEKSLKSAPVMTEDDGEASVAPPKHITHLSSNNKVSESAAKVTQAHPSSGAIGDDDQPVAEAEDVMPLAKPVKPVTPAVIPAPPVNATAPKILKPVSKPVENTAVETIAKPGTGNDTGTRWYLNAGSFSQKANAVALQDSLKQQGFATTLKEIGSDKGIVYKVRIGPMLDKAKAQAVKNKLSQINVNSFVSPDE
ncbi:SPOR domain-containing protein [Methylomonas sp. AM2-LC]|uniref:SPOR domain-containing protein n=1 Tax=Methylomonas sp. AM2-LC TaxID=3153301 RepID=UPI003264CEC2